MSRTYKDRKKKLTGAYTGHKRQMKISAREKRKALGMIDNPQYLKRKSADEWNFY